MDFKYLKYFIEIVDKQNISKAADSLFLAQPALSMILKKIEEDVGTALILRQKKKWEVTEAGWSFYTYAKQTIQELTYLKSQFQEMEQGEGGTVKIGVASSCRELLTEYLSRFCADYPKVRISIVNGTTDELQKKLDDREIEIAFFLKIRGSGKYESKDIEPLQCYASVPKSWGWGGRSSIKLEDFNNQRFIKLAPMKNIFSSEELYAAFAAENIQPVEIITCKDITMVIQMVAKGLGVAVVPKLNLNSVYKHEVDFFKIEDYEYLIYPVMICLKDKQISKAAETFWNYIH